MTDGDVPDGDDDDATADEPAPERSNGPHEQSDHSETPTETNGDDRRNEAAAADELEADDSPEPSTAGAGDEGDGAGDESDTSHDAGTDPDDEDSDDSSGEEAEEDVIEPSEELARELIDEDRIADWETMEPDPTDGKITSEDEIDAVEWDPDEEDDDTLGPDGEYRWPTEAGDGDETDDQSGADAADGRTRGSPRERDRDESPEKNWKKPARRREPDEFDSDGEGAAAAGVAEGDAYRGGAPAETVEPDHAPDDEEMPLAVHVEEMVKRLGVVIVLMAGVSAVIFPFGEQIINVIWYAFLPGSFELCPTTSAVPQQPATIITGVMGDIGAGPGVTMAESASIKPACPRVYTPLATIFARLKVATLGGFVIALPAFVYQTYLFMRPGLFPRERRYYLAAVPTSLVLAAVGVAFAYLLVLPAIFTYFLYYSEGAADIAFGLTQTFDLMVLMMGFFAAIFQIPLFIMLAIMMGVTSRQWLADRRLLFWAGFAGVAFIFNPDPTGMAPFIIAATMIVLFEGTLLLLSWTGSEGLLPSPGAVAARRPYAWVLAGLTGYLASSAPLPEGYYDVLPALVRGFIESNDLLGVTPLVVGGAIIAAYELAMFLLRRYLPVGKWRRTLFTGRVSLFRLRSPVWLLSLVVGYLTSPNPFLLDRAGEVALAPIEAAGLTVGLIVAFEVLLALWRYLRPDADERLPIEK